MGVLRNGVWHDVWYDTKSTGGAFVRDDSRFRGRVDSFPPGRYRLYVSYACPWAHRTLIVRALMGLEAAVPVTVVEPRMLENGWEFGPGGDPETGARFLHEIYRAAKPDYSGRVTVPVLWDTFEGTIVNNESSEILRLFDPAGILYPAPLRAEIDAINERIYANVNNGVYRAGFATSQAAYEAAFEALFDTLDWLEARLSQRRYLLGERITEADWRLFTTLVRFDAVYHGHFKCNKRRLVDYPNLWGYTRDLYQVPGVADTVRLDHIKAHYYGSHPSLNPSGIVPKGPEIDFSAPHERDFR